MDLFNDKQSKPKDIQSMSSEKVVMMSSLVVFSLISVTVTVCSIGERGPAGVGFLISGIIQSNFTLKKQKTAPT